MYTPAMMGLFQSLLGQGHPLLGDTPMVPAQPTPLFPHPYTYGQQDPNMGANPYGGIDTSGPSVDSIAGPMAQQINATPVPQGATPHFGLMQHLQAFFQNNPQALQGLMGAMQGPTASAPMQAPSIGIVASQPWNSQGHF